MNLVLPTCDITYTQNKGRLGFDFVSTLGSTFGRPQALRQDLAEGGAHF